MNFRSLVSPQTIDGSLASIESKTEEPFEHQLKSLEPLLRGAIEIGYAHGAANVNRQLGLVYRLQGTFEKSLFHLSEAISFYEREHMDADLARALLQLAALYQAASLPLASVEAALRSSHYYERANNPAEQAKALFLLTNVLNDAGDYDHAKEFALNAIELFTTQGNVQYTALAMGTLGLIHLHLDELEDALAYTLKAYEEFEREDLKPNEAIVRNNLANIYLRMGRGDLAITYAGMARQIAEECGMKQFESSVNLSVGEIYESIGNDAQAETYYNVAIQRAEDTTAFGPLEIAHQRLAGLCRRKGRMEEAVDHLEASIAARERQHEFEISAFRGHFEALRQRFEQPMLEEA